MSAGSPSAPGSASSSSLTTSPPTPSRSPIPNGPNGPDRASMASSPPAGTDFAGRLAPILRDQPGHRPGIGTGATGDAQRDPGTRLERIQKARRRKEQEVMSTSLTYQGTGAVPRDQAHTLFAQTMGFVALTAALFALGAYLGRDLTYGVGFVAFIIAFGILIGMRFAARRSESLAVGLLGVF